MDLDALQKQSWQVSEDHGFHKAQLEMDPKILATFLKLYLIIGELHEAGEELRAGHSFTEIYYKHNVTGLGDGVLYNHQPWCAMWTDLEGEIRVQCFDFKPTERWSQGKTVRMGKPEGFPIELADALIRLADVAEDTGVDLSEVAEIKEAYNRTREFMHGKTA